MGSSLAERSAGESRLAGMGYGVVTPDSVADVAGEAGSRQGDESARGAKLAVVGG